MMRRPLTQSYCVDISHTMGACMASARTSAVRSIGSDAGITRSRVELGVRSTTPSGVGMDVSGSYDGIGSGSYSAVTGRAMVGVPF